MSIEVVGSLKLRANYRVTLDMTEEEFDRLSEREQNDEINDMIDWKDVLDNSDLDELDVDDITTL